MLYIWWDIQGIVYYELFKSNESITGNRYQLRLNEALLEKKPAVASNQRKYAFARQYSTTHCKSHRGNTDAARMVLPYPAYSPDLAPSDYYLFQSMQHGLVDTHFRNYEDVRKWIDEWIASKDQS